MRTYSSGSAALLRFSIASVKAREVLLIDEALATGGVRFRKSSEGRIRELRRDAGTVFLVGPCDPAIRETRDCTIWLKSGAIRQGGRTEEVLAAYQEFSRRPT
jgi:teichoic acid transport system ATP-binding protein